MALVVLDRIKTGLEQDPVWNLEGGNVVLQQLIDIYRYRYRHRHTLSYTYIFSNKSNIWGVLFSFLFFFREAGAASAGQLEPKSGGRLTELGNDSVWYLHEETVVLSARQVCLLYATKPWRSKTAELCAGHIKNSHSRGEDTPGKDDNPYPH